MHEQVLIVDFRPGFLSSIFLLVTLCLAAPTASGQEEKVSSRQGTAALQGINVNFGGTDSEISWAVSHRDRTGLWAFVKSRDFLLCQGG